MVSGSFLNVFELEVSLVFQTDLLNHAMNEIVSLTFFYFLNFDMLNSIKTKSELVKFDWQA